MRPLRENMVVQFSVVSFGIMAIIAVSFFMSISNEIRSNAIDDLVKEAVGASSGRLLSFLTAADLEAPMYGARYDRFDDFVSLQLHVA